MAALGLQVIKQILFLVFSKEVDELKQIFYDCYKIITHNLQAFGIVDVMNFLVVRQFRVF